MTVRPDDLDDRDQIDWAVWMVNKAIKYTAGVMMGAIAFLHFETSEVAHVIAATPPELVLKGALALFFFSWWGGSTIDLDLHKLTLAKDPGQGKLTLNAFLVFTGFVVVGFLLLRYSTYERVFAGLLVLFWFVLTAAGEYTRRYTSPMFYQSTRFYAAKRNFYQAERLMLIMRYFYGPQMWLRNRVGFGLVGLVALVTYIAPLRAMIGRGLHYLVPALDAASIAALVPASMFLIFVLVTEAWQWAMRINAKSSLAVLSGLRRKYALTPYDV